MLCSRQSQRLLPILGCLAALVSSAAGFEGRICAVTMRGSQSNALLYTMGTNLLRVEITATNRPNVVDILDLNSGVLTLLFPNNRSFVRLKSSDIATANPPAFPLMPMQPAGLPSAVGPQTASMPGTAGHVGPTNFAGMPAIPSIPAAAPTPPQAPASAGMPAMPMMPPMMMQPMELKATDQTTNLLGYACACYNLKQRGQTMEIWATDQIIPFQPYLQNQPHRFGPRMLEDQWGGLLKAKKLFPLLATLKFENGSERLRFEVTTITPQKLTSEDMQLFEPAPEYTEIQPLPF